MAARGEVTPTGSAPALPSPMLVFGAGGQLGSAVANRLSADVARHRAACLSRADADFTDSATVLRALERHRPVLVINAAAYTAVDHAEQDVNRAFQVNAIAPEVIARWCRQHGACLVHMSTDYVFNGCGERAWREDDSPEPLNVYGASKLEGERLVALEAPDHLIFRTSWVFDAWGRNFLTTMMRLANKRDELSIVTDQIGAPTFAGHLAGGVLRAVVHALALPAFPSGLYHLCAQGETSWHGFAEQLFAEAEARKRLARVPKIRAITSEQHPTATRRPLNSRLDCDKVLRILNTRLPSWQQGVIDCLEAPAPPEAAAFPRTESR